jgi:hypothetical protein
VKSLGLLGRICQLLPPVGTVDILEDDIGVGLISDGSTSRANIRYILEEFSVFTVSLIIAPMLCCYGANIGSWNLRLRGLVHASAFFMKELDGGRYIFSKLGKV